MKGDNKPFDSQALSERLDINFALQAAGLGVWEYNPISNQVVWDDRCRALFGLAANNRMSYEQAFAYIHPNDVARIDQAAQWVMNPQSGGVFDQTYRTIGVDDGKLRWVHFQGKVDFTPSGEVARFAGVAQEVTSQMLDKQQLVDQQTQFYSIIQQTPAPTLVLRGDDYLIDQINQPMLAFIGRGEEVIGQPFLTIMPELAGQFAWQQVERVYLEGVDFDQAEVRVSHLRKGILQDRYYDVSYRPLREGGQITGMIQVAVDVTQQVLTRQQIVEVEARLRTIVTNLPSATVVFRGPTLVVETPSQYFIDIIDRGADVTGKPLGELMPELESQSFLKILDEVYTSGQPFRAYGTPITIRQADGSITRDFFDLIYTPLFDFQGQVYAILSVATNVTEVITVQQKIQESEVRYRSLSEELDFQVQQRTEELAATNEELAATNEELEANNEEYAAINEELEEANALLNRSNDNLQRFAYIASHDLQEPLRKIQQFGNLLTIRAHNLSDEELVYIERMQLAASRMSTLIRDLLDFSRLSTQREISTSVALNEVVNWALTTLELITAETKAEIKVEALPTIWGDASQLGQLFQNLLSNALKFRQATVAPSIQINSETILATELPLFVKPLRASSAYYRIDVRDNGIGFDEKYLDRIFQVFQRLHGKSQYSGTGVGLAICEKVVTNHGGAIYANSQPGQGATFSVYLPIL